MPFTQAYVNEVLNHLPSTIVVDEATWPELIHLLKYEKRDLTTLVIGRMTFRMAVGGYEGMLATTQALLTENDALRDQIRALNESLEQATAPVSVPVDAHG